MGTVIAGAADFYSGRLTNRERSEHFVDEFIKPTQEARNARSYLKRKVLELQAENVVPLCSDRCHIVFGHFNDFRLDNPAVREDCAAYLADRMEARKRCGVL